MRAAAGDGRGEAPPVSSELSHAVWWECRLLPYRSILLFLWSALVFTPTVLPGALLWIVAHVLLSSLLSLSGSVLEVCGNLMVILAILYALLQLGLRYGHLSVRRPGPEGNADDHAYKELCLQLAISSQLVGAGLTNTLNSRVHQPSKFYGVGFVLSFLLYYIGQWLSTGLCLHITLSALLLAPLFLERHKPQPELLKDKLSRAKTELKALITNLLASLKQTLTKNK